MLNALLMSRPGKGMGVSTGLTHNTGPAMQVTVMRLASCILVFGKELSMTGLEKGADGSYRTLEHQTLLTSTHCSAASAPWLPPSRHVN